MFIGLYLPADKTAEGEDNTQAQKDTMMWRIPFGIQYVSEVLTVMAFEAFFPEDSVIFNIANGNDNQALSLISRIYPKGECPEDILDEIKSLRFVSDEPT